MSDLDYEAIREEYSWVFAKLTQAGIHTLLGSNPDDPREEYSVRAKGRPDVPNLPLLGGSESHNLNEEPDRERIVDDWITEVRRAAKQS